MNLKETVKPWVFGLDEYVPGKTIEGCIKLASNENNYGPSMKVVKAIRDSAGKVYVYPYRYPELKEKIARYCKVKPENVILGNGSDELMDFVLKTFRGRTASVYPSYAEYELVPRIYDIEPVSVPLDKNFKFNVKNFIKKIKNTNILFLGNPNNPTGTVISKGDIEKILKTEKIVVVDEAYVEFYGKSVVELTKKYNNLIVLRTFAKAFGLAGLRVGYMIADAKVIGLMERIRPPFNVNSIAIEAAVAALDDVAYMKKCVEKIRKDRKILYKELGKKFKAYPSEANFLLVDVSPMSADGFYRKLLDKKIIVRKFGKFSGFRGNFVRISVGTEKENGKLIQAVREI